MKRVAAGRTSRSPREDQVPLAPLSFGGLGAQTDKEVEAVELRLLLQALLERYGLDLRGYSGVGLFRRLRRFMTEGGFETISAVQDRVLHHRPSAERLLRTLLVSVTSFFRDPELYVLLADAVLPGLAGRGPIRIWHAGCSTGEEVYSLAILLREAGLAERCRIYATDVDEGLLAMGRDGTYPRGRLQEAEGRYREAGGRSALARYWHRTGVLGTFDPLLRANIVFARHNLVTDGVFNEFQLVLCRNVLIYFDQPLRERAHHLFHDSLAPGGALALGLRESLGFMESPGHARRYQPLGPGLYRKRA